MENQNRRREEEEEWGGNGAYQPTAPRSYETYHSSMPRFGNEIRRPVDRLSRDEESFNAFEHRGSLRFPLLREDFVERASGDGVDRNMDELTFRIQGWLEGIRNAEAPPFVAEVGGGVNNEPGTPPVKFADIRPLSPPSAMVEDRNVHLLKLVKAEPCTILQKADERCFSPESRLNMMASDTMVRRPTICAIKVVEKQEAHCAGPIDLRQFPIDAVSAGAKAVTGALAGGVAGLAVGRVIPMLQDSLVEGCGAAVIPPSVCQKTTYEICEEICEEGEEEGEEAGAEYDYWGKQGISDHWYHLKMDDKTEFVVPPRVMPEVTIPGVVAPIPGMAAQKFIGKLGGPAVELLARPQDKVEEIWPPQNLPESKNRAGKDQRNDSITPWLVYDRDTGKPKGFGFCEYGDTETANSARRNLNGIEVAGRTLRVDSAIAGGHGSNNNLSDRFRNELIDRMCDRENLYGEPCDPAQCPEIIMNHVVCNMRPWDIFGMIKEFQDIVKKNPAQAEWILHRNPQFGYALLQGLVVMKSIDPERAASLLHPAKPDRTPLVPPPKISPPETTFPAALPEPEVVPFPGLGGGPGQPSTGRSFPVVDDQDERFNPRGPSFGLEDSDLRAPPRRQEVYSNPLPPSHQQNVAVPGFPGGGLDEERRRLLDRVMHLSEDQIASLPPEQRQSILLLKEQLGRR
ncbi:unnamed protein product [Cyprideis torosa]|uniref:Uncharacterized protein n=1 Tax=Cyprideis torosa TaxID=163714 RepID=A0A7R8ZJK5_9CRUS|nr:unnamed protein product [Cyprideis torosa]CAG0887250.1 unnamed protein product [Cyprideis torosa]